MLQAPALPQLLGTPGFIAVLLLLQAPALPQQLRTLVLSASLVDAPAVLATPTMSGRLAVLSGAGPDPGATLKEICLSPKWEICF